MENSGTATAVPAVPRAAPLVDCKSFKSVVPYFLLHLTNRVFESCERETLQDVDKNSNSFYSKK